MPPEIVEAIAPLVALISVGTFVLIGMRMRLKAKSRPDDKLLERLSETVDELFDQSQSLREDVAELHERLEFHERLLTRGRDEPDSTPSG